MSSDQVLSAHNIAFLEALYEEYERDPNAIDPQWREVIDAAKHGGNGNGAALARSREDAEAAEQVALQAAVHRLIENYRLLGHLRAQIDPLGRPLPVPTDALDLAYFGLGEQHLDRMFDPGSLYSSQRRSLRDILGRLQRTYTRHVGVEYWQIIDVEQRSWLAERMESCENEVIPPPDEQRRLLRSLTRADAVDRFLHAKFIGAKRFSIAGAESIIALLETLVDEAGDHDVDEIIFGMAHRGRLSVLLTILGHSPAQLFSRFAGEDPRANMGSGDVKYHLGCWRQFDTEHGKPMYLALTFNPSHLEAITPVISGRVRANQDRRPVAQRIRGLGVTLHGDAAFMGQGVVAETINLARLEGYGTEGSIRVVINNQVGFTTNPDEDRSTIYATATADMLNVPIFHVNGDDPEAAAYVAKLAIEFRQRFCSDVVIDLVCYRRFGHNEADEPTFTQPVMYELISKLEGARDRYEKLLIARGTVTHADCEAFQRQLRTEFEDALGEIRKSGAQPMRSPLHGVWESYCGGPEAAVPEVSTAVSREAIDTVGRALVTVPAGFSLHPKLKRLLGEHEEMLRGGAPVSWALGEQLAYGTLLLEGHHVRLSGQDVIRGTFTHRHCGWVDTRTEARYFPLRHLPVLPEGAPHQGRFDAFNSPLSEFAVMGFEFGYSLAAPDVLVVWEAQFGDFANGAQIVIDQFLSSSEDKWNRISGLTLFLPHGFEGQGPEHSSARLERFLQLCAEDNMQVCMLSTPAQLFHVLRRQMLRKWRKPLVIMTPKSLLRTKASFSPLDELVHGELQRVMDDATADPAKVTRVLLCSGKIAYDLLAGRDERGHEDVAIVRVEQFYPFPGARIAEILARYRGTREVLWVQEEPRNMGAWPFMRDRLEHVLGASSSVRFVGRPESASPATGSIDSHELEQKMIVDEAFDHAR